MLYFQVVILAGTVMLVYYCEFTDTFSPVLQGFICRDPSLTKPDPGPEQDSLIQPVILYSVVGGLPVVLVSLTVNLNCDLNTTVNKISTTLPHKCHRWLNANKNSCVA